MSSVITPKRLLRPIVYKGLEPFREVDADLFFGRDDERDRLVYSMQSSRLTVVYGARQIGKTSLLLAGVANELRRKSKKQADCVPDSAVVVFKRWSSANLLRELSNAIDAELKRIGIPEAPAPVSQSERFLSKCESWIKRIGAANGSEEEGELFLLFDQFEDYLSLNPNHNTRPGSFDVEFAKIVSTRGLCVNCLIAVRDDLLAGLDRYRSSIPNLFTNLIRLEGLTKKQAQEAIQKPIYSFYNQIHEDGKIGIEAELVRAVLDSTKLKHGLGSEDTAESLKASDQRFEPSGLQLAMRTVWEREAELNSHTLRYQTFENELGGLSGIINQYLDSRSLLLTDRERHLCARIFDHLVTPGASYQLSELARKVGISEAELKDLIEKLVRERIVVIAAAGQSLGAVRYEMAQRILVPAIIDRVQDYFTQKSRAEKRFGSEIRASSRLFFEKSQIDGLKRLIDLSETWSIAAKDLLVSEDLKIDLRKLLLKTLDNLSQRGQLGGYKGAVSSIAFTPDGKTILTGSEDGSVRLWDTRSLSQGPLAQTDEHETWIWALRVSSDGKWVATGSDDGTVALWRVKNSGFEYHRSIPIGRGSDGSPLVRGLSFSTADPLLAIAATDGRVRLWHLGDEKIIQEFSASKGRNVAVRCVEFHPNGRILATGDDDGKIAFWDLDGSHMSGGNDSTNSRFNHASAVWAIRFDPNGEQLASCSEDHSIKLWDLKGGHIDQTLIGHTCWVLGITFNSDGTLLASASEDGTARLWDREGKQVGVYLHGAPVNGICFSPDDQALATAAADCKVRLWSVGQRRSPKSSKQFIYPKKAILLDVSFSVDGKSLATGATDNQVQIWNEEGSYHSLSGHKSWIMCVVFNPISASSLATGSIDGTARIWNIMDGTYRQFAPGDGPVWSVAFSPDGCMLATGSSGGKICLWDLREGRDTPVTCFSSEHGSVWSVRFSPDGESIAVGCHDGSIQVRDITGKPQMSLAGRHEGQVLSLSFCPCDRLLASSSSEGRICIWHFDTREVKWCENLDAPIWSVSFSPNGEVLASGSVDRSVCLWNVAGERLAEYSAEGPIRGLAFSRDGKWLAGSCSDGTVRLWPTSNEDFESVLARAKCEWDQLRPFVYG